MHANWKRMSWALGAAVTAGAMCGASASVVLTGDLITVGVDTSGGLVDAGYNAGIIPAWDPGVDFIRPGVAFEFYAVGVGGATAAAGYSHGDPFGATTIETSSGSVLSARTVGSLGQVAFTQDLSFDRSESTIHFSVTFVNIGILPLDLVYARGLDPDQDWWLPSGVPETLNAVTGPDSVTAVGPLSGNRITLQTASPVPHVPTVDAAWVDDPYLLLVPHDDGDGDYTINLAFDLGTVEPGGSKTVTYEYLVQVPEPAGAAAVFLLGALCVVAQRRHRD